MKKIKYTKEDLSAVLQQLNNIHKEKIKPQNDAVFIKFDWLDLSIVDESDDEFFNLGVREETPQQFSDRVNSLMNSYDDLGWDTSFFPPCVGLNGKPRDGRGRIISAKRYGYDKIPIAIYEYPDDSLRTNLTCGLLANIHAPAVSVKREDVIEAGLLLVSAEELEANDDEVAIWLRDEVHIEKMFRAAKDHTIIRKSIVKRCENGKPQLVKRGDSDQIKSWIKTNLKLQDRKDYILTSVDNISYSNRTWCEGILPLLKKGIKPVNIITYTGERDPKKARKNMKGFVSDIHTSYKRSCDMFNNKELREEERPYQFIGAFPQIVGDHFEIGEERKTLVNLKYY